MKDNILFITAMAISIILHLYLLKIDFSFAEGGRGGVEIPVTFIPDAKKSSIEKSLQQEKQITLPDDKPNSDGYYASYNKDKLLNSYLEMIKKEISSRKFSPPESIYYGLIGNSTVGFTINGNGDFTAVQMVRSSGDPLLDKTAVNAVYNSSGKVKRPAATGRNNFRVNITVKYQYGL